MTRKLATVRTVSEILPIEGADRIELARIDGWQCVVKKGEFSVGDQGLYFEIDSVLPQGDVRFEFLKDRGYRVKTVKLRKVLSQGLLLPLGQFTPQEFAEASRTSWEEALRVTKWEPTLPAIPRGDQAGTFPSNIPKTDQERIQNVRHILAEVRLLDMEITEKLDGTSCTMWQGGVASRNFSLKLDVPGWYTNMYHSYNVGEGLARLGRNLAIQGEIIGPGIQGNKYHLPVLDFFVFDIFDIDRQAYLPALERYDVVKTLGLKHVPVVPFVSSGLIGKDQTLDNVLAAADGPSALNPKTAREGYVFKGLGRSFKAISNAWLLKHE